MWFSAIHKRQWRGWLNPALTRVQKAPKTPAAPAISIFIAEKLKIFENISSLIRNFEALEIFKNRFFWKKSFKNFSKKIFFRCWFEIFENRKFRNNRNFKKIPEDKLGISVFPFKESPPVSYTIPFPTKA